MNTLVHVLAYDDHADGNTYLAEEHYVDMADSFVTSIELLARHDNVLITDDHSYDNTPDHDYYTLAPYSIIMSLGIYASSHTHLGEM